MTAGRPRKPTAEKEYEGNPGKRTLDSDDFVPDGVPIKPVGLSRLALWHWDLVVSQLVAKRVATAVDTPSLIAMCCAWARWKEQEDKLALEQDDGDIQYRTSVLWVMFLKQYSSLASKFGLTPVDRAGLVLGNGKSGNNPLEQFLSPHVPCRN
jgi:phage terminase small subunit